MLRGHRQASGMLNKLVSGIFLKNTEMANDAITIVTTVVRRVLLTSRFRFAQYTPNANAGKYSNMRGSETGERRQIIRNNKKTIVVIVKNFTGWLAL
jgi:hypothetical protein